jgi:hypothetical protein
LRNHQTNSDLNRQKSLPDPSPFSQPIFIRSPIVENGVPDYSAPERSKGGEKTMKTILGARIEFNPQRDVLGKMIERNRNGFNNHPAGLKVL